MRNAIEMYASEHGGMYPGVNKADGSSGGGSQDFIDQLTKNTSLKGETHDGWDKDHPFGPYLRKGIPPLPVGTTLKGNTTVRLDSVNLAPAADDSTNGWVYSSKSGEIIANCSDADDQGKLYSDY